MLIAHTTDASVSYLQFARQCKNLGVDDYRYALEQIDDTDFEVDNFRFIHRDHIDEIMVDELSGDTYILGCFNPEFIAGVTDLDYEIVKALQEADKFEAIGDHIINNDYLTGPHGLQQEYVRADGYGHHFAHYDGEEHEIGEFYVFRVN